MKRRTKQRKKSRKKFYDTSGRDRDRFLYTGAYDDNGVDPNKVGPNYYDLFIPRQMIPPPPGPAGLMAIAPPPAPVPLAHQPPQQFWRIPAATNDVLLDQGRFALRTVPKPPDYYEGRRRQQIVPRGRSPPRHQPPPKPMPVVIERADVPQRRTSLSPPRNRPMGKEMILQQRDVYGKPLNIPFNAPPTPVRVQRRIDKASEVFNSPVYDLSDRQLERNAQLALRQRLESDRLKKSEFNKFDTVIQPSPSITSPTVYTKRGAGNNPFKVPPSGWAPSAPTSSKHVFTDFNTPLTGYDYYKFIAERVGTMPAAVYSEMVTNFETVHYPRMEPVKSVKPDVYLTLLQAERYPAVYNLFDTYATNSISEEMRRMYSKLGSDYSRKQVNELIDTQVIPRTIKGFDKTVSRTSEFYDNLAYRTRTKALEYYNLQKPKMVKK